MAKKCKMISLDTSSTKSGWAYYEDSKYKSSGVVDLDTKECRKGYKNNSEQRVKDMCLGLLKILNEYKPDIIIIEKLNVSRNMNATRILAKVIGCVYSYAISHNNCYYFEIQATQWRSQLGMQSGRKKRAELKQLSVNYVKKVFDKDVSDDEADAICAGLGYIKMMAESEAR